MACRRPVVELTLAERNLLSFWSQACSFPLRKVPSKIYETVRTSAVPPELLANHETAKIISVLTLESGGGPAAGGRLARKSFRVLISPSDIVATVTCTLQTRGSYEYPLASDDWDCYKDMESLVGCFLVDSISIDDQGEGSNMVLDPVGEPSLV